jgi:uncharacterized protein YndB with AHSA1/START domain
MALYADHPSITISREIAASPADLWPLISDINLPARFSVEFQGAEWTGSHAGPALGATFEGTNSHPAIGEWKVPCSVAVYEPERAFGWDPGGPDAPFSKWRFTLERHGETTTLTYSAQMGFGPSGLTPAIEAMPDREEQIVGRRLEEWRTNMTATVEGIRLLAEG